MPTKFCFIRCRQRHGKVAKKICKRQNNSIIDYVTWSINQRMSDVCIQRVEPAVVGQVHAGEHREIALRARDLGETAH